jgi:hypothetical protein
MAKAALSGSHFQASGFAGSPVSHPQRSQSWKILQQHVASGVAYARKGTIILFLLHSGVGPVL